MNSTVKTNIFKERNGSQEKKFRIPIEKQKSFERLIEEENDKYLVGKVSKLLGVHATTSRKLISKYLENRTKTTINNLLSRPWK